MGDITKAIKKIVPAAEFSLQNDDLETLNWLDSRARPSDEDILAAVQDVTRDGLKAHVNAERERRSYGPLAVSTGHSIDTGPESRSNINGKVLALQVGTASGPVGWHMADDVTYEIAEADFIQIAGEVEKFIERLYAFSWSLKSQVDSGDITSTDQIDAADWPAS